MTPHKYGSVKEAQMNTVMKILVAAAVIQATVMTDGVLTRIVSGDYGTRKKQEP